MIATALIILIAVFIVCLFIPDKYLQSQKPRRRKRYHSNDEYWTGLPWMGGCKEKEEKLLGRLILNTLG